MGKMKKLMALLACTAMVAGKYCRMRIQQRYQRTGARRTGGI